MAFPSTIYALLRNLTYLTIEGAASVTLDAADNVIEVYDLDSHRNLFDAGSIGRQWAAIFATATGGGQLAGTISSNGASWSDQGIDSNSDFLGSSVFGQGISPESFDDRLSKTPPTPTLKQRTMIKWWSGAAGTGDPIAMCWSDQFIGYSGGVPRFVQ